MRIKNKKGLSLRSYIKELSKVLLNIEVTGSNKAYIELDRAFKMIIKETLFLKTKKKKVLIVGNGGSSSIANHMAVDLWKNAKVKALSFSDSALLTCISNDFGYQHVFEKPIDMFAEKGDILFAISSSGKSENILRAAACARKKGCIIITMSGFKTNNPLRFLGKLNFYVPVNSYGFVELAHSVICHCIVDELIQRKG